VPASGGVHAERTTVLAAERRADDAAAELPKTLRPSMFVPLFITYKPEAAWVLATVSRCTIRTRRVEAVKSGDPWTQAGEVPGWRPHVLAQLVRSCARLSFAKDRSPCDAIGCASC
jgi:hypothetical protein